MEVKFKDSFLESFEKMIKRERWYWKSWDFLIYDLPRFFKNIWIFRKALYNHRWWTGHHSVFYFMETSLNDIVKNVDERGNEVRETSEKKIQKMRRAVEILQHFRVEDFIDLAERDLGITLIHRDLEFEDSGRDDGTFSLVDNESDEEKENNRKIFDRSREIEENMFKELWKILEGQDYSKFEKAPDDMDHNKSHDHWNSQFDGSGIRGWWD
jgi:hypothetical protein